MSTNSHPIDALLAPISPEHPCGVDLRSAPDWVGIQEARRSDDTQDFGIWEPKERRKANWRRVKELTASALADKSKDIQLAIWYCEASIKLDGFAGLNDGLRLIGELLSQYGDRGLHPVDEEVRIGRLGWLNHTLSQLIYQVPITARYAARNYSYLDYEVSKAVGSLNDCRTILGEVDVDKQLTYEAHLADGHISQEIFHSAVAATDRNHFKNLQEDAQKSLDGLTDLQCFVGEVAESTQALKKYIDLIQSLISYGREEPSVYHDQPSKEEPESGAATVAAGGVDKGLSEHGWKRAEYLVRIGMIEQGFEEMGRIASTESTGRERFQRKLRLAETYRLHNRTRVAAAILEELADQIDHFNLEAWESPDLVGRVWSQLYDCYREAEKGTPEAARAEQILKHICRLAPWRALRWL